MKLKVLGCSGGIGAGLRTTALLVDHDVLIDAGTGVGDLSVQELADVDHVFVTHSHLDHVCSIPFLADTVGHLRNRPVVVHAIKETIAALRRHLFNGDLWPDFTRLPSPQAPYLQFNEIRPGQAVSLGGRSFAAIPAAHAVPAAGYWLDSGHASLVFSGDTGPNAALWEIVNAIVNLRHLFIETAFSDRDCRLALLAQHLCPRLLAEELRLLQRPAQIHITHLKPADSEITMREIAAAASEYRPRMLAHGQVFEF
jgi:ribonuclease BN (tRNA processing enzyme)